jgi:hypothetical protein
MKLRQDVNVGKAAQLVQVVSHVGERQVDHSLKKKKLIGLSHFHNLT